MRRKKVKIRNRILSVFAVLMLSSFSLTGVIFNLAARQYIENSAINQLESADEMPVQQGQQLRQEDDTQRPERSRLVPNVFRIKANVFHVDEFGNMPEGMFADDEIAEIMLALKEQGISLENIRNLRITTGNGIYYVSAQFAHENQLGNNIFRIVYADVTGLSHFANSINFFLILLVCVMFFITVVVTFFLSNSITRPIKKLSAMALNIGRGDFTPTDLKFQDAEFENLNTALNKTAKQLGLYDSEQKSFFQNVSHELRTPLMSIQCYAEGISLGLMDPKTASETILLETQRLTEMVKDLLYVSKIDNITSAYATTHADIKKIISDCVQQQKAVADSRQVSFTYDFGEPQIYCECANELISRAVSNLISNAIRYASSEIRLSCHKEADQVVISVADDGAGIDAESMPHIFERFYKGTGGNHGIGLSLAKSIVEQHCGSITAENMDSGGAIFTISLPDRNGGGKK